jgi:hypothetical protein
MKKSELIAAIQKETLRHEFSTFVDEPPGRQRAARASLSPAVRPAESEPTRLMRRADDLPKQATACMAEVVTCARSSNATRVFSSR